MTEGTPRTDPRRDNAGPNAEQDTAGGDVGAGSAPAKWSDLDVAGLWSGRDWANVSWVVVDVEGNGQRPPDLVEAACLPIDGGVPGRVQSWLVRPPRPITGPVRRIHGIRNADVATAPTTAEVAEQILGQLAGRVVVGHHVHVDLAVLGRELRGWSAPAVLDTLRLAKAVWPGRPSYSLDNLPSPTPHRQLLAPSTTETASARTDLPPTRHGRHRAGYDVALTAGLFLALAQTAAQTGSDRSASTTGGTLSAARLLSLAGALPASLLSE